MKTLLCYGDSNTHGTLPRSVGEARGRHPRGVRWTSLLAERFAGTACIVEEGLPSRTTVFDDPIDGLHKNGWRTLEAILESHRPLDAVVLMLGTNDLKPRYGLTSAEIAAGVERLATRILARGQDRGAGHDDGAPALLIVAPPHVLEGGPFDVPGHAVATRSRACSQTFAEVAARLGCAFLDAGPLVAFDPADGVHLDAAAHATLATAIGDALQDVIALQGVDARPAV